MKKIKISEQYIINEVFNKYILPEFNKLTKDKKTKILKKLDLREFELELPTLECIENLCQAMKSSINIEKVSKGIRQSIIARLETYKLTGSGFFKVTEHEQKEIKKILGKHSTKIDPTDDRFVYVFQKK